MGHRVFLTGLSGYLGGVLAEHLSRCPEVESVTGIGLSQPRGALPPKVRFQALDIRSPNLAKLVAGHEVVIHTAAIVLWSARMPARERDDINLNGTRNVAQAARAAGATRFLHASSMAVYDPRRARGQSDVPETFPLGGNDPYYYYWSSKAQAERIVEEVLGDSRILLTSLRPIYIIGPRNRATITGMRQNAVNFPGQNPRRQFIHEDDVAEAFLLALRTEMPGAFNVVPDDFLRMREVCRQVGARRVPTVPVSVARALTWLRWRWFGSPIHPSWVEDLLVDFTGSNARLKAAGWRPRYGSAEALQTALAAVPASGFSGA